MMVRKFLCLIYLIVFGVGCGMVLPKSSLAATEAYYRFEPGGLLLDSSGNGRNLIYNQRVDGGSAPAVDIPSGFPNPVPVTGGVANTKAIEVNNVPLSTSDNGYLATADHDVFSSPSFTIEAFIRPTDFSGGGGTQVVVSHWNSTLGVGFNERSWYLGLSNRTLRLQISANGEQNTTAQAFDQLVANNDYYIGASLHFQTDIGPGGEDSVVRLYLRNLTTNGPLQTAQVYTSYSNLFNSSYGLSIGSTSTTSNPATSTGGSHFFGYIDEVRFSTGILAPTELLGYDPNAGVISPPLIRANYSPTGPLNRIDVTLNGDQLTRYNTTDMVPATLVEYAAHTGGLQVADILMPAGTTTGQDIPADRSGLLGDLNLATGFIDAASWTVNFAENIVNRPGPDIVLFDFGSPDSVDVTINGTTKTGVFATTTSVGAHLPGPVRFQSLESPVLTLADLQAATFPGFPIPAPNNTNTYGIDLSDFGFANGASLTAGTTITFSGGTTIDPLEVIGLKEPVVSIPGDFDGDGDVDGRDFLLWQRGQSTNGNMDPTDLANWQDNYGLGTISTVTSIPEPSGLVLLLLGNFIGIRRSRKVLFS